MQARQTLSTLIHRRILGAWMVALLVLAGCGGGDGPALQAQPQTLTFEAAPSLWLGAQATVLAQATSGLPARYSSLTPAVCTVVADTGVVTALSVGECRVAANQAGNTQYAPASPVILTLAVQQPREQHITVGTLPTLSLYGSARVEASASSGLPVQFSTATTSVCTVDAASGQVTSLAAGDCVITVEQPGNADVDPATAVSVTLHVDDSGAAATVPGAPTSLQATLGDDGESVVITIGALSDAGGLPVQRYTAVSNPAGLSVSANATTLTLHCPASGCAGYTFSAYASNALGDGARSAAVEVVTTMDVVARFYEPDTQPNDSIFSGSFVLNSSTRTVTALRGQLSESMTGSATVPMTQVSLSHTLVSLSDGGTGALVSSFALPTVDTFYPNGFADTENGIYFGWPDKAYNPATANSFITLDLSIDHPTAAASAAQIARMVYGDCAPGGMMGSACMTGVSGGGTMGGYPVSLTVSVHH